MLMNSMQIVLNVLNNVETALMVFYKKRNYILL
jgi:hypothetical protein